MPAVADLERFLERVFERTSARLFRSRIQAVQVERRVERAMEAGRSGRGSSTVVPSRYRVRMQPADLDDLAGRTGGYEALAVRLADRALAFARLHAYHLPARPVVSVVADPSLERGRVEVDAGDAGAAPARAPSPPPAEALPGDAVEPGWAAAAPAGAPPPDAAAGLPPVSVSGTPLSSPDVPWVPLAHEPAQAGESHGAPPLAPATGAGLTPSAGPASPADVSNMAVDASDTSRIEHRLRTAGDRPYDVRPAAPPPSRALLRVVEPGGHEREVRVEGAPLTLGRAPDNGLVIADPRVSRRHGRFQTRHGTLVYTDLGSTNGTRVNGIRVDEIVLGPGDRIQVGDVVVVVEHLPG